MVFTLIFAGGTGYGIGPSLKPKQFLEVYGKPVIIYTLEHFENHKDVDEIVVVCLESHINELKRLTDRFGITKVSMIVPGGKTGHDSIYNGLKAMKEKAQDDDIVLIHDGVRPLITEKLVTDNIEAAKKYGAAITVEPAKESVVQSKDQINICYVPNRNNMYIAKAPQSFSYKLIYEAYEKAAKEQKRTVDSAQLCSIYNIPMYMVESTKNNIKISVPEDYYMFRALYEAMENQQIFGI
ncbi:2-C-methyl-D-erythritol 4-phosphate cytidylyltransferase [Herbinix hemicellulosilytica]|uniref:2-C-methyl-D-erythritol 4-phosphate cytidylyltransferase n=1 Tax=Herbinix hemicellulosilytica TaxID=1564487 RepID=A0A0H5SI89_HERHM|nr:IspD/TarI family cytidylyltransferase [Herbinix hemicellulosilytica]RBP59806.1 2-C-methyl-D-erythritol 4-phosphate cytidylyltransferase [Herbinix hemicellulosilytica]CRZ35194.1 2-C-methyl-D-erythritol 4-phosphate cytidylyltransferase [Herbinix hemicellulosilytica]